MKFTATLAILASLSAIALGDCPAETWDNTDWATTTNGAQGTGTCRLGYYADGPSTPLRNCHSDGTWETQTPPNPRCLAVVRCIGYSVPDEFYSFPSVIPPGTAFGNCFSGYRYTGTGGAKRQDCNQDVASGDGIWSGVITGGQVCTRNTCPAESFQNADWPFSLSLTDAAGTCVTGYSGSPTRTCGPSHNTWSATVNNPCTRNQCAQETVTGSVFPQSNSLTNDVQGTCDTGYSETGGNPPTRDCGATDWEAGSIVNPCTRNICQGETAFGSNWDDTNSLESDTQPCLAGFVGDRVRPCNADGSWGAVDDSGCTPAPGQCPEVDWDHTHWAATSGAGWAPGTCHPGFGSVTFPERLCLESGTWSHTRVRNRCITLYCDAETLPIQGGNADWLVTKALRTPRYPCPSGGYVTRHCNGVGEWEDMQGDCLPA